MCISCYMLALGILLGFRLLSAFRLLSVVIGVV